MEQKLVKPYKSHTAVHEAFSVDGLDGLIERNGCFFVESKIDGMSIWVEKSGRDIAIYSSDKIVLTSKFPKITRALESLEGSYYSDFIVVGELVAIDNKGVHLPHEIVVGLSHKNENYEGDNVRAIFYDFLRGDEDLRRRTIAYRRGYLEGTFKKEGVVSYIPSLLATYSGLEVAIRKMTTQEGVVIKDTTSTYDHEGSKKWAKLKWHSELDLIVLGKRLVKNSSCTWNYEVGFQSSPGDIVGCGKTMNTNVIAETGDIISCQVERVKRYGPGKFGIYLARVSCRRDDKTTPDPESLLEIRSRGINNGNLNQ